MKTLARTLAGLLVATTFGITLVGCGGSDGGSPDQVAEPKPVDPANQVSPGSAKFQNPEQRSGN